MSTNTWLAGIAVLACGAILGLYQPEWRLLFYIGKPLATLAIIALARPMPMCRLPDQPTAYADPPGPSLRLRG